MPEYKMLNCFKAYDIRGRLGVDLDEDIAFRIGRAFAQELQAKRVVLGRDCRESSENLVKAVADGLMRAGVEVLDLRLCGTEEVYFATGHLGADGGICVTASHNPIDYNGMKIVGAWAAPLDAEVVAKIKELAQSGEFVAELEGGKVVDASFVRADYVKRVLSFVDIAQLRPLRVVVNAGNGAAGPTFDAIADALSKAKAPIEFIRMHHAPDGQFPNGIPNPLLIENQPPTIKAVRDAGADMGIAFDGDFDRCFFFDDKGNFVPGEYVVSLLAEVFLAKEPGVTIIHEPRVIYATQNSIFKAGGKAVICRSGHTFLKRALREHDAVYGGEMSAHHYFKDFYYCDSGMIPWLLIAELLGRTQKSLCELLSDRRKEFPSSGEINFRVDENDKAIARVEAAYLPHAVDYDRTDGLSIDMGEWRFNLRGSNTEPLLRLNVESLGDAVLLEKATKRLSSLIEKA